MLDGVFTFFMLLFTFECFMNCFVMFYATLWPVLPTLFNARFHCDNLPHISRQHAFGVMYWDRKKSVCFSEQFNFSLATIVQQDFCYVCVLV